MTALQYYEVRREFTGNEVVYKRGDYIELPDDEPRLAAFIAGALIHAAPLDKEFVELKIKARESNEQYQPSGLPPVPQSKGV